MWNETQQKECFGMTEKEVKNVVDTFHGENKMAAMSILSDLQEWLELGPVHKERVRQGMNVVKYIISNKL